MPLRAGFFGIGSTTLGDGWMTLGDGFSSSLGISFDGSTGLVFGGVISGSGGSVSRFVVSGVGFVGAGRLDSVETTILGGVSLVVG